MYTSLRLQGIDFKIERYDDLLLLRATKPNPLLPKIGESIYAAQLGWIKEVIPTQVEIGLVVTEYFRADDITSLQTIDYGLDRKPKVYRLPILFTEGADWRSVEDQSGLAREDITRILLDTTYELAMIGFTPGFLYLNGLDPRLIIPRKATPTKKIPAGTISIGSHYLGLYALSTPSGWYAIGRTPLVTFEVSDTELLVVRPGDQIRLEPINPVSFDRLQSEHLTIKEYNA